MNNDFENKHPRRPDGTFADKGVRDHGSSMSLIHDPLQQVHLIKDGPFSFPGGHGERRGDKLVTHSDTESRYVDLDQDEVVRVRLQTDHALVCWSRDGELSFATEGFVTRYDGGQVELFVHDKKIDNPIEFVARHQLPPGHPWASRECRLHAQEIVDLVGDVNSPSYPEDAREGISYHLAFVMDGWMEMYGGHHPFKTEVEEAVFGPAR